MRVGLRQIRKHGHVREYIVTDKKLRKLLFQRGKVDAYYVDGAIYYRSQKVAHNKSVRRHELEHARQERFFGRTMFQILYGWSQTLLGYDLCPFEKMARLRE